MSEIRNRPNPLNQYAVISCDSFTASSAALTNVTGITALTGSSVSVYGNSGSINFGDCVTTTGSVQTNLALKVTITGSTYAIPLYSTA